MREKRVTLTGAAAIFAEQAASSTHPRARNAKPTIAIGHDPVPVTGSVPETAALAGMAPAPMHKPTVVTTMVTVAPTFAATLRPLFWCALRALRVNLV